MTHLNFLTACWWVMILFWTVSALSVKPTKERQHWGLGHWWKLNAEEALLLRHFPEAYQRYRSHTKALAPFLF
jgi:protein-S-isoprenylcysteine O-methyltransferase Ste14